jgi:hypothetical protein
VRNKKRKPQRKGPKKNLNEFKQKIVGIAIQNLRNPQSKLKIANLTRPMAPKSSLTLTNTLLIKIKFRLEMQ